MCATGTRRRTITMRTWQMAVWLVFGATLVAASVLLRTRSGGKYEVKTSDLTFLVIPLLLAALATGKLKGFDLFGVKADLSALWSEAAQDEIKPQVARGAPVSIQDVMQAAEMAMKGGASELQRIIERKVDTLAFRLGNAGYYAPAIRAYVEKLSGSSHLRSIVVQEPDGALFGMYVAGDLTTYLNVAGDQGYEDFRLLLARGDGAARDKLAQLPGFIGAKNAVTASTSKRDALATMAGLDISSLPVVDAQRRFVGTVDRSKLTASLILTITDKIEGGQ